MSWSILRPRPFRQIVCSVCGMVACCNIYGPVTCTDCAQFFYHALLASKFYICRGESIGQCSMIGINSRNCSSCRLDRCYLEGMRMKYIFEPMNFCYRCYQNPPKLCSVCFNAAAGIFFGTYACMSCATFFHYATMSNSIYVCRGETTGACTIFRNSEITCHFCLLLRCFRVGMKREDNIPCNMCICVFAGGSN